MAAGLAVTSLRTNSQIQDLMLGGKQLLFEKNVAAMTKMNRLLNLPLQLSKPNL